MCSAPTSRSSSNSGGLARFIAFVLLLVATRLAAQSPEVSFTLKGPASLTAKARQSVTFAVVVRNDREAGGDFQLEVSPPEGWRTLSGPATFSLASGESRLTLVSVRVPSSALVGDYPVACALRDRATGSALGRVELVLSVEPQVSLNLEVLDIPQYVIAGDRYELLLSLSNTGNVDVGANLAVTSSPRYPWSLAEGSSTDSWVMAPGARQEVRILVQTDRASHEAVSHHLTVTASPRDPRGTEPRGATSSTMVQVIPLSVGGATLMHGLGADIVTTLAGGASEANSASITETVKLDGSVDEPGKHHVEATVSKRLATNEPLLDSPADRYVLAYRGPLVETTLGDQDYSAPPLLAGSRAGRGLTAALDLRPVRIGIVALPAVPGSGTPPTLGATVEAGFPAGSSEDSSSYHVGLGFTTPARDTATLGLSQLARPFPGLTLGLDGGLSIGPGGLVHPAVQGTAEGRLGAFSYALRALRAWPGFVGTPTDEQFASASGTLRLLDGALGVNAGMSWAEHNLELDAARSSADRTLRASVGAGGRISAWDSEFAATLGLGRRIDRFVDPDYLIWEMNLIAGWRQGLGPVDVGLSSTVAYSLDETDLDSSVRLKAGASLAYLTIGGVRLGFASGYDGTLGSSPLGEYEITTLANLDYSWPGGAVGLSLDNDFTMGAQGFQGYSGSLSASLRAELRAGGSLEAHVGLGLTRDRVTWQPSANASVTYRLSTTIPLYRRHDSAVVRGRLYEARTGFPLAGVLVRLNGLAAMTADDGKFEFNLPHGGTYLLHVGGGSLPVGMIGTVPLPMLVEAPPGSTVSVDLTMIRGATVAGTIALWGTTGGQRWAEQAQPESSTAPAKLRGFGGILVEISGSGEVRRRLTSASGQFSFQDLRPGFYTVKVLQGQIPSLHRIEKDTSELVLAEGERRELEFRIVPEERRLTMVQAESSVLVASGTSVRPGTTLTLTTSRRAAAGPDTAQSLAPQEPAAVAGPAPGVEDTAPGSEPNREPTVAVVAAGSATEPEASTGPSEAQTPEPVAAEQITEVQPAPGSLPEEPVAEASASTAVVSEAQPQEAAEASGTEAAAARSPTPSAEPPGEAASSAATEPVAASVAASAETSEPASAEIAAAVQAVPEGGSEVVSAGEGSPAGAGMPAAEAAPTAPTPSPTPAISPASEATGSAAVVAVVAAAATATSAAAIAATPVQPQTPPPPQTPTSVSAPTPAPAPTVAPRPSPAPTSTPRPSPAPAPSPSPSPRPTAQPTPTPTGSPLPRVPAPAATPTPWVVNIPTAQATPTPISVPGPSPTPQPRR